MAHSKPKRQPTPGDSAENTKTSSEPFDLIAELEKRTQPQPADLALRDDPAVRAALVRGDHDALRARLDEMAPTFGLSGRNLQLRCTLALLDVAVKRYGLEAPALDIHSARAVTREFLEELAIKCVALETVSRVALLTEANSDDARRVH